MIVMTAIAQIGFRVYYAVPSAVTSRPAEPRIGITGSILREIDAATLTDRISSVPTRPLKKSKSRLSVEQLEGRDVPASGLGVASDFSVFVMHEANVQFSGIGGRVAVGGNASFSSYVIGDSLTNSNGTRDDLIVGGNLNFMYGQVYNGNVVYGGTGTLTSVGLPHGTAHQGSPIELRRRGNTTRHAVRPIRRNGPDRNNQDRFRDGYPDRKRPVDKRLQRDVCPVVERDQLGHQCPSRLVRDRERFGCKARECNTWA